MNSLKSNLMIIFIISGLLFKRIICDKEDLVLVFKDQIKLFSNGTVNAIEGAGLPTMMTAAYDHIKKCIYIWESSEVGGRILQIQITEKEAYTVIPIVNKSIWPVRGLAYNNYNSTLYYTTLSGIYYVQVQGEIQDLLTGTRLLNAYDPRDITIDGRNGYVYWVNMFPLNTTIERSPLNKEKRVVLAQSLYNPRSLTVDMETNTLYWTDVYNGDYRNLYSSVNGGKAQQIYTSEKWSPIVIALHDQNMYWIDSVSKKLWVRLKDLSDSSTLLSEGQLNDQPIRIFVRSGSDANEVSKKEGVN